MLPTVTLLAATQIDWATFLETCQQNLSSMPTKPIDDAGVQIDQRLSFLLALGYMQGRKKVLISELGNLLDHLSYSFLILAARDSLVDVIENTRLRIVSCNTVDEQKLFVVTGTLHAWYEATLELCNVAANKHTRIIGNAVVMIFERAGFGELWRNTRKSTYKDSTFLLESK